MCSFLTQVFQLYFIAFSPLHIEIEISTAMFIFRIGLLSLKISPLHQLLTPVKSMKTDEHSQLW